MRQFVDSWQMESVFVIDAAFYSKPNIQQVSSLKWVSRVPQTLSDAQALVQQDTSDLSPVACETTDYRMWETTAEYGGVTQRWILIESQTRKADKLLWEPELKKLEKRLNRDLKQLEQQVFACKPDALEALMRFQETLAVHQVTEVTVETIRTKRPPGTSAKAKNPKQTTATGYRLKAKLERRPTAEATYQNQRARFILATNQLDVEQWPADKLRKEYKGQQKTERGFRFLKDPLFFTSSPFVKKAQRVEALALVMALTLMVYTLAERKLRQTLAAQRQTVLDQKKQPTAKPTFRWVIQTFQGIHLVRIDQFNQISNLTDERRRIIRFLGSHVEPYYALS